MMVMAITTIGHNYEQPHDGFYTVVGTQANSTSSNRMRSVSQSARGFTPRPLQSQPNSGRHEPKR